eukprot:TRINITY_DN4978_c0_g1_i2.p1 TRINITY_DN4978_c0_g1~~TRINITY_DN4978_c0_g1_i2.p1  ORF type:complete len:270 (+),score=43.28 TRINITY_DN4978_c0_g1_i2:35-811(+)
MEDDMKIVGQFRGKLKEDFFAIFDGHNGDAVAKFVAKQLCNVLEEMLEKNPDPIDCLKKAFKETNYRIKRDNVNGGCTALAVLVIGDKAYVANTGDCRAVLCKGSKAIRLTRDHKPDDQEEKTRIEDLGGTITSTVTREGKVMFRVNGVLSISRAFGDFDMEPFIISDPDVKEFDCSDSQFLILGCDGLWDVISDQEAVDIVMPFIHDCESACKRLRDVAYARGSTDNISAMLIRPLSSSEIRTKSTYSQKNPHCSLL